MWTPQTIWPSGPAAPAGGTDGGERRTAGRRRRARSAQRRRRKRGISISPCRIEPSGSRLARGFFDLAAGVPQPYRPVEDRAAGRRIARIDTEVAGALELEARARWRGRERGLHLGPGEHGQRLRIQGGREILLGVRIGLGEERLVQPHLRVHGVRRGHPVDGALDAPSLAVAAHGGGIVLAAHLDLLARGVLY